MMYEIQGSENLEIIWDYLSSLVIISTLLLGTGQNSWENAADSGMLLLVLGNKMNVPLIMQGRLT